MRRFDLNLDDVLWAVKEHPCMPTYYYRNVLSKGRCQLKTASVLSRLKTLEKRQRVKRAFSSYAVMICWEIQQ